jgi:peptide deformylase
MILHIFGFGHPILKKKGQDLPKDYANLSELVDNMYETMYHAKGIGLAAPQVGMSLRLFVVDTIQIQEEGEEAKGIKKAFINPQIISETGKVWEYEEGCLSIPNVHANVSRHENLKISFYDENFVEHTEDFDGMNARVIQHEYDHIEGVLFVEKINPLKKRLVQRKLDNIKKGQVNASYKMKFAVL